LKSLNFRGQFNGNKLGIPNHTKAFAKALSYYVEDLRLQQLEGLGISSDEMREPNPEAPTLIFWYPTHFKRTTNKTIGYFIFEYTIIPYEWVNIINSELDVICTASKWAVDVLINNGVTIPCYVIPGGVDHNIFKSSEAIKPMFPFKFLHVGKAEERKGTEQIIEAFIEAFGDNPNTTLTLMIDNPHIPGFSSYGYLWEVLGKLGKISNNNIQLIDYEEDIVKIYNQSHCAVFASKAEGIGLPIVESMACGLPTIVPLNSGITDYANDINAILLKHLTSEPIYDKYFFPTRGQLGWWEVSTVDEISSKMKWVIDHYEAAKVIGTNAERYMAEFYTWDRAARLFLDQLK
jgi:glycosyltransferase involved in cell wall biosynthesis